MQDSACGGDIFCEDWMQVSALFGPTALTQFQQLLLQFPVHRVKVDKMFS